jgi:hypothetical protein
MESKYIGGIVVLILSAILALATDRYFPSNDTQQKRFWALILFILSFVLGLSVNGTFDTSSKMDQLNQDYKQLTDFARNLGKTHEVTRAFEEINENPRTSRAIRKWILDAQQALIRDLNSGYIPIPREDAPQTIGTVYDEAKTSIVASNVGGLAYYFDYQLYGQKNRAVRDRHVPVIRFFLYSNLASRGIKLTKTCEAKKLQPTKFVDFKICIEILNTDLGSLCSVVLDFDTDSTAVGDEARDLLLMDNSFVAETELFNETWTPKRAKATESAVKAGEVDKVQNYFRKLWGVHGACTARMNDNDVELNFPQFKNLKRTESEKKESLADVIAQRVIYGDI